MKFAYADPPYIGQAFKHYKSDPNCAEVDHQELIAMLLREYPDGWVLSCSSVSLKEILGYCPPGVRVGSWVKPFSSFKPGVTVAYTWEPVVFMGGRKRPRTMPTVKDHVIESITLKKGLTGVKPDRFSFWVFELLNMQPGDQFDDLFPGSGAVSRAWETWLANKLEKGA